MTTTTPTIQQLIDAGAIFVCSHSGGKDSQAMYCLLRLLVPANQIIVVHAHLGEVEWAGVQDHIRANIEHKLHVVEAIDKIRDTAISLERIFLVEVMGRNCGYIALRVALAGGCEEVILPERNFNLKTICNEISQGYKRGKLTWIII